MAILSIAANFCTDDSKAANKIAYALFMREMLSGALPVKQRRILDGWMALHEEEVYEAWNFAVQ